MDEGKKLKTTPINHLLSFIRPSPALLREEKCEIDLKTKFNSFQPQTKALPCVAMKEKDQSWVEWMGLVGRLANKPSKISPEYWILFQRQTGAFSVYIYIAACNNSFDESIKSKSIMKNTEKARPSWKKKLLSKLFYKHNFTHIRKILVPKNPRSSFFNIHCNEKTQFYSTRQTSLFFIIYPICLWTIEKKSTHIYNPLLFHEPMHSQLEGSLLLQVDRGWEERRWMLKKQKKTHTISPSTKIIPFIFVHIISFCSRNLCWCTEKNKHNIASWELRSLLLIQIVKIHSLDERTKSVIDAGDNKKLSRINSTFDAAICGQI